MLNKQECLHEIKSFITTYFPNSYAVMVTGSFVTEYFNETSDLDIIILSGLYRNIFIESYLYHGLKMQVIVMPVFDLDSILIKDLQNGGIYIGQLNKGKILKDTNDTLKKLQARAQTLYYHGPVPISKYQYDQLRARITTKFEDIKGNDNYEENLFTAIDLYPRIIDLFFKMNNYWSYSSKYACRELLQKNPDLFKELISSLENFIAKKDKNEVLAFTSKFLEKTGGELHFSSTREYSENRKKDKLIILVSSNNPHNQFSEYDKLAKKFEDFILMHCPQLQVCSYFYPSKRIYKSGLYIICYYPNQTIDNEIIPLIEMFHFALYQSHLSQFANNFFYPYDINPFDIFGDTFMQRKVASLLSQLRNAAYTDIVLYAIAILKQFKDMKIFESSCIWYEFWKFCYDIFDKSGNIEYLPQNIIQYFSNNKKEINKQRYSSQKDKLLEALKRGIILNIRPQLQEIESSFNESTTPLLGISNTILSTNKYLKGKESFCMFLVRLIEAIMNRLGMQANDQLFVIYFILQQ